MITLLSIITDYYDHRFSMCFQLDVFHTYLNHKAPSQDLRLPKDISAFVLLQNTG